MAEMFRITAEVSTQTLQQIAAAAAGRGMTVQDFASEAVRLAAEDEAQLAAAIERGRRQFEAGEYLTHDELVADLRRWRRERTPTA